MGKVKAASKTFEKLSKLLGVSPNQIDHLAHNIITKDYNPIEILKKVNSPEIAEKLSGIERQQYLKALDDVYGLTPQRMEKMGFDPETYYHGTDKTFKEFIPSTNTDERKIGVFATKDPELANSFAIKNELLSGPNIGDSPQIIPIYLKKGKSFDYENPAHIEELYDYIKRNTRYKEADVDELKNLYRNLKEGNWSQIEGNEAQTALKGLGYDSFHVGEHNPFDLSADPELIKNIAIYDPAGIRSKFAAFDPRFAKSRNIAAGAAGATLATAASPDDAEAGPLKDALLALKASSKGLTRTEIMEKLHNIFKDPKVIDSLRYVTSDGKIINYSPKMEYANFLAETLAKRNPEYFGNSELSINKRKDFVEKILNKLNYSGDFTTGPIISNNPNLRIFGSFSPYTKNIEINTDNLKTPRDLFGTIIHELTHSADDLRPEVLKNILTENEYNKIFKDTRPDVRNFFDKGFPEFQNTAKDVPNSLVKSIDPEQYQRFLNQVEKVKQSRYEPKMEAEIIDDLRQRMFPEMFTTQQSFAHSIAKPSGIEREFALANLIHDISPFEDALIKNITQKRGEQAAGIAGAATAASMLSPNDASAASMLSPNDASAEFIINPNKEFGTKQPDRIDNFLKRIAYVESSGARNMKHKMMESGMHKGDAAIGAFGLMPNTINEIVNRAKSNNRATSEMSQLLNMDSDEKRKYLIENPKVEYQIARHLAQYVLNKQDNDEEKAAFAWNQGHNLSSDRIDDMEYQDHNYVKKFNEVGDKNIKQYDERFKLNPAKITKQALKGELLEGGFDPIEDKPRSIKMDAEDLKRNQTQNLIEALNTKRQQMALKAMPPSSASIIDPAEKIFDTYNEQVTNRVRAATLAGIEGKDPIEAAIENLKTEGEDISKAILSKPAVVKAFDPGVSTPSGQQLVAPGQSLKQLEKPLGYAADWFIDPASLVAPGVKVFSKFNKLKSMIKPGEKAMQDAMIYDKIFKPNVSNLTDIERGNLQKSLYDKGIEFSPKYEPNYIPLAEEKWAEKYVNDPNYGQQFKDFLTEKLNSMANASEEITIPGVKGKK